MNQLFLERNSIKSAGAPVDINLAAFTGARVDMGKAHGCAIVCHFGDSTGAAVDFDLDQHDAATGGTSKALNIVRNYYHKADGATTFTKVELRADDAGLSDSLDLAAIFGGAGGVVVFDVRPEDLDVNGGFNHISANLGAAGAAKIASVEYHLYDTRVGLGYEQDL